MEDAEVARYNQVKSTYLKKEIRNRACCVPNLLVRKKELMEAFQKDKEEVKEEMEKWMDKWDKKMEPIRDELKNLHASLKKSSSSSKKNSLSSHGGAGYSAPELKYFNDLIDKEGIDCSGKHDCKYIIDPIIEKMEENNVATLKVLEEQYDHMKEVGNKQLLDAEEEINKLKQQLGGAKDTRHDDLLGNMKNGRYELKDGPTKVTVTPFEKNKIIKRCETLAKKLDKQIQLMNDAETDMMNKAEEYKISFTKKYIDLDQNSFRKSIGTDSFAESEEKNPYGHGDSMNGLSFRKSIKDLSNRDSMNGLSFRKSRSSRSSSRADSKHSSPGIAESKNEPPEPPKKKGWFGMPSMFKSSKNKKSGGKRKRSRKNNKTKKHRKQL